MADQPTSTRKRLRAEEDQADDRLGPGRGSQRRYDNTAALDQSRQHNGDHYANINIYHGAGTGTSAPRSPEPGSADAALERLMFDEMDARYLTINASLTHSSCRWLFERQEYQRWQNTNLIHEHHGFLWIKGKAGAGKSTLLKYAFDTAEKTRLENHTVVSFFFNARGAPIERSLEGMFRALLHQILQKLPHLRYLLSKKRTLSAQSQNWSVDGLRTVFRDVVESIASERLTCYVDALDECTEDDVQEMVSFFEDLGEHSVESGTRFYVCFASRHYPYISIDRSESLVLEDQQGHKADISTYVSKKLKISDKSFKREISKQIEDRASGIFLWVVLVVKILIDECNQGRAHLVRERLKEIPTRITDLIKDILQRDQATKYLVPLLQWILFSKRPLSREELFLALQSVEPASIRDAHSADALTRDNMEKFILNTSKGLAEMSKGKIPRVQFIHELVRSHFLGPEGLVKLAPDLQNNLVGQSHDRLKQCCYNYLVSKTCYCIKLPAALPKAESDKGKTLRSQTVAALPLLQYTVDSILYHANAAHAEGIAQHDFVRNFPLVKWRKLDNALARYTSHRHTPTTSKAYILAEQGCAALLEDVMESLPHQDAPKERCLSLLGAAIDSRDAKSVQAILKRIDYRHSNGKGDAICMTLAIHSEDLEIVQALVDAKVKPYKTTWRGTIVTGRKNNALALAASQPQKFDSSLGRFGLLRLLFNSLSKADLEDYSCVLALESALEEVCKFGDIEMFNLLNVEGVDVSVTALVFACKANIADLACFILEAEIPTLSVEWSDHTMQAAASVGHEDVVRLLLRKYPHNEDGSHPFGDLLVAASGEGYELIVRLLLEYRAEIESVNAARLTALHSACRYGHLSVARLLIESCTRVESDVGLRRTPLDRSGATPLLGATRECHVDVARLLLDRGADVDQIRFRGRTALWDACSMGNETVAQLLIDRGANVDVRDSRGVSALFAARGGGHLAIVSLLISVGASYS